VVLKTSSCLSPEAVTRKHALRSRTGSSAPYGLPSLLGPSHSESTFGGIAPTVPGPSMHKRHPPSRHSRRLRPGCPPITKRSRQLTAQGESRCCKSSIYLWCYPTRAITARFWSAPHAKFRVSSSPCQQISGPRAVEAYVPRHHGRPASQDGERHKSSSGTEW
jgi:hypothetical protein